MLALGAGWNEAEFRAFGYYRVQDAVLLPAPRRPVPVMVGSQGPRMLRATLPHVAAWNCWYSWYGNSVDGFGELSARIGVGVRRSACVLVAVDGGGGERPFEPGSPAVTVERLGGHLADLAAAGADEAILVLDPVRPESVAAVGRALAERR